MDEERFQQMEKRLNKQVEATRAMNETLNKFIVIMGNQEAARNVAPPPPVSPPHVTTTLQALQPFRVKPGIPSHFDGDRVQGHAFPTSCELYISLTQSDFVDEQVRIHWAPLYFKGGCVASFAERILRQELRSGKMCFTSWHDFTEEFAVMFCPCALSDVHCSTCGHVQCYVGPGSHRHFNGIKMLDVELIDCISDLKGLDIGLGMLKF
jgi:hypothetical protein